MFGLRAVARPALRDDGGHAYRVAMAYEEADKWVEEAILIVLRRQAEGGLPGELIKRIILERGKLGAHLAERIPIVLDRLAVEGRLTKHLDAEHKASGIEVWTYAWVPERDDRDDGLVEKACLAMLWDLADSLGCDLQSLRRLLLVGNRLEARLAARIPAVIERLVEEGRVKKRLSHVGGLESWEYILPWTDPIARWPRR